ncbi:hypothetical protein GHT06_010694 [Daphnia sinensis]|uniref:Uncharacterized protein n=1 Tax=Daphnia sinensis TaxID=1820382 RepID=A0AAD5PX71_9CRUS|nr:hypothetical protein GHT06_010694 [Daphnia sinensis]
MGPRKQNKSENGEHQSPIYLKHVSNFKASLRRRDSQRFLRTKYYFDDLTCQTWKALTSAQINRHSQAILSLVFNHVGLLSDPKEFSEAQVQSSNDDS